MNRLDVSIPFRADTGFEPVELDETGGFEDNVSIPFRADTGFERRALQRSGSWTVLVSIPFRADTGFELIGFIQNPDDFFTFQSLSGLTLGLNNSILPPDNLRRGRFNPFQG